MTEWKTRKLSDVVGLLSGFAYKSSDWQETGVPVLKITNVRNGRVGLDGCSFISKKLADESINFEVKKGDLLITLTGEIGATGFYAEDFDARLNQRVGRLVPKNQNEINLKFVAYFLEAPQTREIMWATAKGVAQANISPKEVLGLDIALPSIDKQHKIVELLEDHLSRLDAALADVKQAKLKAAQFRRSMLQAAFFGYFSNEIFQPGMEIPPSWRKISMEKILQPRKQKDIPLNFPDLPYIGMEHVSRDTGLIDSFGSSSDYRSSAPRVHKGDVLYGRLRPYLNKVAITQCDAFASGEFIVLPPNKEINGKFLQLRLLSQDFVEFAGTLDTGDRPRVSWEQIAQFEISLPPIDEQIKLIEILEDHLSRLDASVTLADTMEKQSSGLRRSLLQAAFTGQLTNEVASV